jgi:hypothetical protein
VRAAVRGLALLVLLGLAFAASRPGAAQGRTFFVNTTLDSQPSRPTWCVVPVEPCTLRTALDLAQVGGGTVTACFAGAGDCPPGRKPLSLEDPGYDAALGRWFFTFDPEVFTPLGIDGDDVELDFTQHVDGWSSPADNKVVLDAGTEKQFNHFLVVSANNTVLAGFEVRGSFVVSAIVLRDGAEDSRLGPGLVLAGIEQGYGLMLRGSEVSGNRVVGSWCGLSGDGTVVLPVQDDCIVLQEGANGNTIGGPSPEERNVLAATLVGNGVTLSGDATRL